MKPRKFLFTYRYDGNEYGFDLPAASPEEAKERIKGIALARYDGEVFLTIRGPGTGLLNVLGPWMMPAYVIGIVGWCVEGWEWLAMLPLALSAIILLDIYWRQQEDRTKRAQRKRPTP